MNGPEHYREAERLVQHSLNHTDTGHEADRQIAELAAAQAQVHATLALAAVQAANYATPVANGEPGRAWAEIGTVRTPVTA